MSLLIGILRSNFTLTLYISRSNFTLTLYISRSNFTLTLYILLGNNTLLLTNTKGGRRRQIQVPPELYEQVAEIIKSDGKFTFQYKTYLRHLKAAAFDSGQIYTSSHGLRWNYAQKTMQQVQNQGSSYDEALRLVSERMGHSRKEITEHYLR